MKLLKKISALIPHIRIILSLCFLTFIVLDWYNPLMGFTTNPLSTKLLIAFCVITMLSSISELAAKGKYNAIHLERRHH